MTHVIVVIGAGLIGQAIARRVGADKHVLQADLRYRRGHPCRWRFFLLGTGSDFPMDGGVTTAYRYGELAPK